MGRSSTELTRSKQTPGPLCVLAFLKWTNSSSTVFMAAFAESDHQMERLGVLDGPWAVAAAGRPRTHIAEAEQRERGEGASYCTYDSTMQKVVGCCPARRPGLGSRSPRWTRETRRRQPHGRIMERSLAPGSPVGASFTRRGTTTPHHQLCQKRRALPSPSYKWPAAGRTDLNNNLPIERPCQVWQLFTIPLPSCACHGSFSFGWRGTHHTE